ncbi:short-chain dehydrogenase [Candidatus Poribacteria bacterium]|nr:short-chain dehydrogenase [Candidatus Poribacteria bacterium]
MSHSGLASFDLTGKTAVVTGGSRGLGKAMANGLARAGADLVIASRTADTLQSAAEELSRHGRRVVPVPTDVSDSSSVAALFRVAADTFDGQLDILLNAAGMNVRVPTVEYTEEMWDAIIDSNLKGTFLCCQEAGRLMIPRRSGRIINIGSLTSSAGVATIGPYGATKMGVLALAKSLAVEWGPHNITANVISPGWFETDLNRALFQKPGWLDATLERMPMGRTGDGEDLADVAVFLASDAARYVTGQNITVDGGFLAGWHGGFLDPPAS